MFIRLATLIFLLMFCKFKVGHAQTPILLMQNIDFRVGIGMGNLTANFIRPTDLIYSPKTINDAPNYQLYGFTNFSISRYFSGTFGLNTYISLDAYPSSWRIGVALAGVQFYPVGMLKRLLPCLALYGGYGLIHYSQPRQDLTNPLVFNKITFTEQQFTNLGIGTLQTEFSLDWVWWSGLRQVKGLNFAIVGVLFLPQSTGLNYWDNLYFSGFSLNIGIKVGSRRWML